MNTIKKIPQLAVLGHPNEGKSSVVSTLTENDKIRISALPGETIVSQAYSVVIDGETIIKFVDTPGFQVPKKTLAWFQSYSGPEHHIIQAFLDQHQDNPLFRDECELLKPVNDGAGIIYVVDGSKPVRNDDRAEMEILRLTGRPRMAIINSKTANDDYLDDWKNEFRKHFNAIRIFNANQANYSQRIALLESLKSIDQDWEPVLEKVITTFKLDWERRNQLTSQLIYEEIEHCLTYTLKEKISEAENQDENTIKNNLIKKYENHMKHMEMTTFQKIKKLFKHNIFNLTLPEYSILHEDLFSSKTFEVLGLSPAQLITAGAVCGGAIGAWLDVAAAGITAGVFTAIGGAIGAGTAFFGGKKVSQEKVIGMSLGGNILQIGPNKNVQFLYILLDRVLLYYSHIINWAHGRRDYPMKKNASLINFTEKGFVATFTKKQQKTCNTYFQQIQSDTDYMKEKSNDNFKNLIKQCLENIIHDTHTLDS